MANFLDSNGVAYLWSKIKKYVDQGGGNAGATTTIERKIIAGYTYQFEETIYLPSGFSATTCRLTSIRWKTKDVPVNYYWKVLAPGVNESPFSSLRVEINSGTVKVNGKIDSKYDRDAIVMELTFTKVA